MNWSLIAQQLGSAPPRNGKSCRLRWRAPPAPGAQLGCPGCPRCALHACRAARSRCICMSPRRGTDPAPEPSALSPRAQVQPAQPRPEEGALHRRGGAPRPCLARVPRLCAQALASATRLACARPQRARRASQMGEPVRAGGAHRPEAPRAGQPLGHHRQVPAGPDRQRDQKLLVRARERAQAARPREAPLFPQLRPRVRPGLDARRGLTARRNGHLKRKVLGRAVADGRTASAKRLKALADMSGARPDPALTHTCWCRVRCMAAWRAPLPRSPPSKGPRMRLPDAAGCAQGARWRRRPSPWTRARARWARRAARRTRSRAHLRWAGAARRARATPPRAAPSPAAVPAARRARPRRAAAPAAGRAQAAARTRARAWRRCWRRCSRAAAAAGRWAGRRAPRRAAPYLALSLARARGRRAGACMRPSPLWPYWECAKAEGCKAARSALSACIAMSTACAACPRDGQTRPGWRTPAELALLAESAHRAALRPWALAHPASAPVPAHGGRTAGGRRGRWAERAGAGRARRRRRRWRRWRWRPRRRRRASCRRWPRCAARAPAARCSSRCAAARAEHGSLLAAGGWDGKRVRHGRDDKDRFALSRVVQMY